MSQKSVDDYLRLSYHIEIMRESDPDHPGWVAWVKELPGCITQADRFEELGEMIADAMRGWLEIALQDEIPIPLPLPDEQYSGKFVVRVPRQLHRKLVEEAERQNVSLNQFVNYALTVVIGSIGAEMPLPIRSEAVYQINPVMTHQIREKTPRKPKAK
jgi:antitoxin HicB